MLSKEKLLSLKKSLFLNCFIHKHTFLAAKQNPKTLERMSQSPHLSLEDSSLCDQLPVLLLQAAQLLVLRGRGSGRQGIHLPKQSIIHLPIMNYILLPTVTYQEQQTSIIHLLTNCIHSLHSQRK